MGEAVVLFFVLLWGLIVSWYVLCVLVFWKVEVWGKEVLLICLLLWDFVLSWDVLWVLGYVLDYCIGLVGCFVSGLLY